MSERSPGLAGGAVLPHRAWTTDGDQRPPGEPPARIGSADDGRPNAHAPCDSDDNRFAPASVLVLPCRSGAPRAPPTFVRAYCRLPVSMYEKSSAGCGWPWKAW
jgi:hypothetical protein